VRWESPVRAFFRTTTRRSRWPGVRIPAGEKVLLFLGAANRDLRRWSDPHRFDIQRNASGHVGFGMGIHRCVGQTVASVERIEITGQPQRKPNNTLRAWSSLPVTLYSAAAG
jgi:4-methoxybenzoate monooxygenase (O-demethylating)